MCTFQPLSSHSELSASPSAGRQTWPLIEVECVLLCSTFFFSLTSVLSVASARVKITKLQNPHLQAIGTSSSYSHLAPAMFPKTKHEVCSELLK